MAALVLLANVAAACGGPTTKSRMEQPGVHPCDGAHATTGTRLDALDLTASEGEVVTVIGFVFYEPTRQRIDLCASMMDTDSPFFTPPDCGAPSLVVRGMTPTEFSALPGATDRPEPADRQWTECLTALTGRVGSGELHLTSR